ncbi:hypothetical protein ACI5KX_10400 [Erythrobacter sp. GH1-10]|uniref:hypothetical protein n=1 Tax=Erythrobacter sp. GH1-10 TaxID=3349334 RepID=UPI0038783F38
MQTPASWSISDRGGHCAVEYYLADGKGGLQFSLQRRPDFSYSMSGLAFERYTTTGEPPERVELTVGDNTILLLGPPDEIGKQARRWSGSHPVDKFVAISESESEFVLSVDGSETTIPLEGFSRAGAAYDACVADMKATGPRGPVRISFDGINQLAAAAGRQRLLSEVIGYTLTIDPTGTPIDCKLTRSFRRKAVTLSLCRPLMKHSRFEPALDADGNAIEGEFSSRIDFDMWMGQDGYLEEEDR